MILSFLPKELQKIEQSNLYRTLKVIENTDGRAIKINGKEYLNFCSNNYLGLANHPEVIKKAKAALDKYGAGAGASRLVSGTLKIHRELEEKLAQFKKREAAIVFSTGYMANLGVISSLLDENDTVIIDRLNHASIVDACRLSKAKLQIYSHCDMEALEKILKRSEKYKKRLIVTDSLFSMDGDLAPLPKIAGLAKKYNAATMIDEAHATGVIETESSGIDVVMGTLSKALGSLGGFVCGSADLINFLRNKAGSFIYTTALPPASCAAALAALEIIGKNPGIVENLRMNSRLLSSRLSFLASHLSPIFPLILGDEKKTIEVSRFLFNNGIYATAIRPPTVPKGQSRLRITLTALHTKEDIECLASLLQQLIPK
ncbi:8-amino-7-oxononanoate synthase [Candidatus Margulisiibacteriota bacterium]